MCTNWANSFGKLDSLGKANEGNVIAERVWIVVWMGLNCINVISDNTTTIESCVAHKDLILRQWLIIRNDFMNTVCWWYQLS